MSKATKKFKLDLSAYNVRDLLNEKDKGCKYPLRANLSDFLRTAGMFKNAAELVEAVMLAKRIRDNAADFIMFDEKEAHSLRTVIDTLLERTADGRANLGGILHEEMICRVANMEEISE